MPQERLTSLGAAALGPEWLQQGYSRGGQRKSTAEDSEKLAESYRYARDQLLLLQSSMQLPAPPRLPSGRPVPAAELQPPPKFPVFGAMTKENLVSEGVLPASTLEDKVVAGTLRGRGAGEGRGAKGRGRKGRGGEEEDGDGETQTSPGRKPQASPAGPQVKPEAAPAAGPLELPPSSPPENLASPAGPEKTGAMRNPMNSFLDRVLKRKEEPAPAPPPQAEAPGPSAVPAGAPAAPAAPPDIPPDLGQAAGGVRPPVPHLPPPPPPNPPVPEMAKASAPEIVAANLQPPTASPLAVPALAPAKPPVTAPLTPPVLPEAAEVPPQGPPSPQRPSVNLANALANAPSPPTRSRELLGLAGAGEVPLPASAQALQPGRVTAPPPRQAADMLAAPKARPEEMQPREPAPEPVPDPRIQAARLEEEKEAFKTDRCWSYKDPTGKVQGPFQTSQMEHWSQAGYFTPDLPIRFRNGDFHPLKTLYPPPMEAFSALPVLPASQKLAAQAQAAAQVNREAEVRAQALREAQAHDAARQAAAATLAAQAAQHAQAQQLTAQLAQVQAAQAQAQVAARQRQMQLLADPSNLAASGYGYYDLLRMQQAQQHAAHQAAAASAAAQQQALVQAQALARQRQLLQDAGLNSAGLEQQLASSYFSRIQAQQAAQLLQATQASQGQTAPKAAPTTAPAPAPGASESRGLGPPPTGPAPVPPKPAAEARVGAQPTHPALAKPGPADRRPDLLAAPPEAPMPPKESAGVAPEMPSEPPLMPVKAPAPQISAESVLKQLEAKAKPAPPKQPAKRMEEDKAPGRAPPKAAQAPLAPPPSAAPNVKPGPAGPPDRKNSDDAPPPSIQSSKDFPTLGGSAEEVVMAPADSNVSGFWERPMRPVKVPNASDFPEPGPSLGKPKAAPKPAPKQKDDEKSAQRREQAKELLTQHGLPLEDPLVGFLLSVGTSAEVHDYLQAYYEADADTARRFTEAFVEKGLISEKPTKEATGGRKKRVKGKEVDPSMLGFTAVPRGHYDS